MAMKMTVTRPNRFNRYGGKGPNNENLYVPDIETVTVEIEVATIQDLPQAYVNALWAIQEGGKQQGASLSKKGNSPVARNSAADDVPF